ncbi:MAG: acyl-CoA thioesterase [Bacteroidota bacterium]
MTNDLYERKTFNHSILVLPSDIDELGHTNNVVYLRWVLEVAEAHWKQAASEELQSKYAWVVLRHEIDYISPSVLNDNLIATTWVDLPDGARSTRHVEIFNQTNNKLSARAKTMWCLLLATTMRPKRIEKDITDVFC